MHGTVGSLQTASFKQKIKRPESQQQPALLVTPVVDQESAPAPYSAAFSSSC